jgi:hypothetical protein
LKTAFLIAVSALSSAATAQKTYKCSDTYSQTPCPGGVLIDNADQRSNAQKRQTDAATGRDAKAADALQKARLQREAKDLAANTPTATTTNPSPVKSTNTSTSQLKKKKKTPEFFTAQAPGERKKKKALKKTTAKKAESTS